MFIKLTTYLSIIVSLQYILGQKCGYDSCQLPTEKDDPETIYVHLISHTHDDVGWLKTVDQYFYGTKGTYQQAMVQTILDSVISALDGNSERKFTYVEMEFFTKWWYKQNDLIKEKVKRLVNNGQLQFVLAGISMSDEAVVHYDESINQLTWGAHFLNETFGKCGHPKVAWQIDPFGHARDQAGIFYDAGFDAVYFQRIDYKEKLIRRKNKSLELMWMTDPSENVNDFNNTKNLFTGIFYDSYCYPDVACFDEKCRDPIVVGDTDTDEYNGDTIVYRFTNYVKSIRNSFASNHILVPMGCDFTFENAHVNFRSTDELIKSMNKLYYEKKSKIVLHYSNPTCYTKAVNGFFRRQDKIPYRVGDFFPYISENDRVWTGYYTSRPSIKGFTRDGANMLRLSEQILIKAMIDGTNVTDLNSINGAVDKLRETMGIMQHHDAITGTEKQHVSNNYAKLLHSAISHVLSQIKRWFSNNQAISEIQYCPLLNISVCKLERKTEKRKEDTFQFNAFIYNSLGWSTENQFYQVPINIPDNRPDEYKVHVTDELNGESVKYELLSIEEKVEEIPERARVQNYTANYNLVFKPNTPIGPMDYGKYRINIERVDVKSFERQSEMEYVPNNVTQQFKYFTYLPDLTDTSNFMISIERANTTFNVSLKVMYYIANDVMGSGAYIFSPKGQARSLGQPVLQYFEGSLFEEMRLLYSKWATVTTRVYENRDIETYWTIGPIPDEMGYETKEVIIRYKITGDGLMPKEEGEFFTDSNGRRMIRRVRGRKLNWNLSNEDEKTRAISENYFPIVNRIQLRGTSANNTIPMAFSVYTDRAHGGSSLNDGEIELMLHRRCMRDDYFGVGEALKENGADGKGLVVRGKNLLKIQTMKELIKTDRRTAIEYYNKPEIFFNTIDAENKMINHFKLNESLPDELHLLSLSVWPLRDFSKKIVRTLDRKQILIRLESLHELEASEIFILDAGSMFNNIKITSVTPMTINSLRSLTESESERLKWPDYERLAIDENFQNEIKLNRSRTIVMKKGSIGTFICEYELLN